MKTNNSFVPHAIRLHNSSLGGEEEIEIEYTPYDNLIPLKCNNLI